MIASEYKIEFDKLTKERGNVPSDWWVTPNHEENKKKPYLFKIIDTLEYKRELNYVKKLALLNAKILINALNLNGGDVIYMKNNANGYKMEKDLPEDAIIKCMIGNVAPQVGRDGYIYFHASTGNCSGFTIDQDKIILKK